ncbi:MAG TPA: Uma2 family endonuclease [Candidatus Elarobacter sp.]|jgi:Uma2 family endonuclease|nr:Uma2 family endonuclease [Candidatus Elarobacter sp.]
MSIHEIVLPETKPETEWILGRAVQKVSPRRIHARLQMEFSLALRAWEPGHGQAATEWRFRIAPPGEIRRPLVPDVAYVSNERLRQLDDTDLELPPFAPDVAIEILSPGDRSRYVEHKIGVYLAGGASLVIIVDPSKRSMTLHDARGVRMLREADTLTHPALPGFSLRLSELFAAADGPR